MKKKHKHLGFYVRSSDGGSSINRTIHKLVNLGKK